MAQTPHEEDQELETRLPVVHRLEHLRAHIKQFLIHKKLASVPEEIIIHSTYSDPRITHSLVTNVEHLRRIRASIGSRDVFFEVLEVTPDHCKLKLAKT